MTGQYLVTRAMKAINAIDVGRVPTAFELSDGIDAANQMLDAWALEDRLVVATTIFRQTFPSSKVSYTIGLNGSPAADFPTTRPVEILKMEIVFNQGTNEVHLPVTLLESKEWLGIPVKNISTSIPIKAYYDYGFVSVAGVAPALASGGLGTIFFNPFPAAPFPDLEFLARIQFSQFDAAGVNDFAFPPGYTEAIIFSLAERLFHLAPPQVSLANVAAIAAAARARIASKNQDGCRIAADTAFGQGREGGSFNWLTGNLA